MIDLAGSAEQCSKHFHENVRGVRHRFPGTPGDVEIRPDEHAAVFLDFALSIPVGVNIESIAARRTDGDDIDRDPVGGFDRGSRRSPALAADAGEQRETALAGQIESRLAYSMMLDPDMGKM